MDNIQEAKCRQEKCTYIAGQTQGVIDFLHKIRPSIKVEKTAQLMLDELEVKYQKAVRGL